MRKIQNSRMRKIKKRRSVPPGDAAGGGLKLSTAEKNAERKIKKRRGGAPHLVMRREGGLKSAPQKGK